MTSPSPFVFLVAGNSVRSVVAFHGIMKAGYICVIVDPQTGPFELSEMMCTTPSAAIVRCGSDTALYAEGEIEILAKSEVPVTDDLDDACMIMYTAADDGFYKAAMLTHRNLRENAAAISDGSNVMKGYCGNPRATDKVLVNGTLFTGDVGFRDNDGYIHFERTKKRMINHGGIKVYPAEVERIFSTNENVRNAHIFGEPGSITGETVCGWVCLKNGTEESREQFKGWAHNTISHFKLPRKLIFKGD